MTILRFVSLVIVCLAMFAFGISAPVKAEPDAPFVNAVVQDCTEVKFNEALTIVQASAGGTLTFLQSCPEPIIFTSQKFIYKNVTIDGDNKIVLSGGNATSHFFLDEYSRLTLKNITLTRGHAINSSGGSVLVSFNAALFTDNVIFERNEADLAGGAIHGYDAITLNSTTVQSNTANSNILGYGGGVNSTGLLTITNSLLRGNSVAVHGGAIGASGKVWIENTTLSGNKAKGDASAVFYTGAAGLTLSNSTVSNHAGEAIFNTKTGIMTISNSILNNNTVVIYNSGKITILGSTIFSNYTGLSTYGSATLINTTFNNNKYGIGVNDNGSASLKHVTIFGSTQYGISIMPQPALLDMIGVVIQQLANPSAGSKNCSFLPDSWITSHGYNLSSDTSCDTYLNKAGDKNDVASGLGALANNGGPTLTHLPQAGSLLIDGGVCVNGISTDQRGFTRPSGAACDIGAVEVQPPAPTPTPSPSPSPSPEPSPNPIVPHARIPIVVK